MLSYMVNRVPPFDDDMRMKMESSADYDELTRRLMNCEMTLEEVDPGHGLLPVIQDTVSIGGQGAIADRENENLGQSDVGVAMLRRVIAREMKALRDGKPLKKWRRPDAFVFNEIRSEERRVGNELSVRVSLGGRRIFKQKNKKN